MLFPPVAGDPFHGAGGGGSSGQGPATATPSPAATTVPTAAEAAESAVSLQPLPEQTGYCGVS